MTTPDWVQDAIFYQIFPDRFRAAREARVIRLAACRLSHGTLPPPPMVSKAVIYMGSLKNWII